MKKIFDWTLHQWISWHMTGSKAKRQPRKPRRMILVLLVLVAAPALAQNIGVYDNIFVRTGWYVTKMVVWGLGACFFLWGLVLAGWNKFGSGNHEKPALGKVIWGIALLGGPVFLDFIIAYFNAQSGSEGALDDVVTDFDFE